MAEAEGEAGGQQDAGVVHELEVQMGLGRVAGVGQRLAGGDPVADPHPERAAAQVGQGGIDAAAQVELFEARGFERTTIDQIAAAADISRRTFFRYFADKEELFFAEDERLLEVIGETLDGAPAGEPVLELARRATRALAAHSAADSERRLARERLIATALARLAG